jgi:hypothetical protein
MAGRRRSGGLWLKPLIPLPLLAMIAVGILGFDALEEWRPQAHSLDRVLTAGSTWWAPATSAGSTISGHVQVRDGDTIVVSGVPVRLRGLHCDERGTAAGERARWSAFRQFARLVHPERRAHA